MSHKNLGQKENHQVGSDISNHFELLQFFFLYIMSFVMLCCEFQTFLNLLLCVWCLRWWWPAFTWLTWKWMTTLIMAVNIFSKALSNQYLTWTCELLLYSLSAMQCTQLSCYSLGVIKSDPYLSCRWKNRWKDVLWVKLHRLRHHRQQADRWSSLMSSLSVLFLSDRIWITNQ